MPVVCGLSAPSSAESGQGPGPLPGLRAPAVSQCVPEGVPPPCMGGSRRGQSCESVAGETVSLGREGGGQAESSPAPSRGFFFLFPSPVSGSRGARGPGWVASPAFCGERIERQFLAVDHSARASMKNAASCEN